eukprot:m.959242 g.959242  ORF g.959242 m.959242 type:complete len:70 (+) comp23882_c0_seq35:2001-2210(+)
MRRREQFTGGTDAVTVCGLPTCICNGYSTLMSTCLRDHRQEYSTLARARKDHTSLHQSDMGEGHCKKTP